MSDREKNSESADADAGKKLDETTPPMKLQQKSLEPSDLEPLEKTTPEMREFLGSQDRARRRK